MSRSRSENAKLNIIIGYVAQLVTMIFSLIGRKIFLIFLSVDYLGINGLYSNILTVLSLAELGLDTAVLFSLYKPVAENDTTMINSLLRYFQKIYFFLAIGITIIGLSLLPFLKIIVKTNINDKELVIFYILSLTNTVASYFVAHKVAFLSACQEQRIQKLIALFFNFILQIIHIIVLLIWKNYYIYLSTTVLVTIINNVILSATCNRMHPYIRNKTTPAEFDKKPIVNRIKSTFIYKIGAVAINNTDNILISILVSTAAVGYYSNYYTIVSAVQSFIAIITTSLISGIGNLGATGNKKKQYDIFNVVLLFYHYISALGFVGFNLLFNDVIIIWLGTKYILDARTVFIISFNFYLTNLVSPIWMYREANGLFDKVRYLMLIRAGINIVFSIIFGRLWGMFGILLATALSLIVTCFWYEPLVLFDNLFNICVSNYWVKQVMYFFMTMLGFVCSHILTKSFGLGVLDLFFKICIVIFFVSFSFFLVCFRSQECKIIKSYLKKGVISYKKRS